MHMSLKKILKSPVLFNLVFIFVFLNVWDFVVNRGFFNAMVFGVLLFSPAVFLWFIGNFRAVVLVTLISIFEFTMMFVFILEGLELSGLKLTGKTIFWAPYLAISGTNLVWGLRKYALEKKKRKIAVTA